MERGLLSDPKLKAYHDDVVWMYLFQDFSHSDSDRAAERVAIRFGITSWPQHFLVDPYTLEVAGDTGRSMRTFRAAVRQATVKHRAGVTLEELAAWDTLAASLEGAAPIKLARKYLTHEDVVVRFRAIERLKVSDPQAIADAGVELLATPHDQTRFVVCWVLAKLGGGKAIVSALEALVVKPTASNNPNVLRMRAVQALARCGGASSVNVVAPHATSGLYFNGLTRAAVDCLVAIARREKDAKVSVADHLRKAFPVPKSDAKARELRSCKSLAHHVHEALRTVTSQDVPFPKTYDVATRKDLIEAWTRMPRRAR